MASKSSQGVNSPKNINTLVLLSFFVSLVLTCQYLGTAIMSPVRLGLSAGGYIEFQQHTFTSLRTFLALSSLAGIIITFFSAIKIRRISVSASNWLFVVTATLVLITAITIIAEIPLNNIGSWSLTHPPTDWAKRRDQMEIWFGVRTFFALAIMPIFYLKIPFRLLNTDSK